MRESIKRSKDNCCRLAARKRGVAAAELAVCLPVLVLIVLATIESCSAMFLKQSLTVAAYEGVRSAIATGGTAATVQTICGDILKDRRVQGSQIKVNPTDIASLKPGDLVSVTISAPCNLNSPVPTTFYRGRVLTTSATMMIEH